MAHVRKSPHLFLRFVPLARWDALDAVHYVVNEEKEKQVREGVFVRGTACCYFGLPCRAFVMLQILKEYVSCGLITETKRLVCAVCFK